MQSPIIRKFILSFVQCSSRNIYVRVRTHVTFLLHDNIFPHIFYTFGNKTNFEFLTHFQEYKKLFSLVLSFSCGWCRITRLMNALNTEWYMSLHFPIIYNVMQITNCAQCGTKYLLGFLKNVPGFRWDINYEQKRCKKGKKRVSKAISHPVLNTWENCMNRN